MPGQKEVNLYRDFYKKYYTNENLKIFDMAVRMNQKSILRRSELKINSFLKMYKIISDMQGKRVYIYGNGNYGRQFYHIFKECGVDLGGYIISDNQKLGDDNSEVYFLSDIVLDNEHDVIFVGVNSSLWEEIGLQMKKKGVTNYIFPDICMFEYLKNF